MQITKYEHACLDITEDNTRLIIDPGGFTQSLKDFSHIDVVVITHMHGDHFDPNLLQKIIEHSPQVKIFTTKEVAQKFTANTQVANLAKPVSVGDITDRVFWATASFV